MKLKEQWRTNNGSWYGLNPVICFQKTGMKPVLVLVLLGYPTPSHFISTAEALA
jgi:hypothetical protein